MNQELLKLIATEPSSDTDDFLEREALNGSEDAKKLLTIEHATEIASKSFRDTTKISSELFVRKVQRKKMRFTDVKTPIILSGHRMT